MPRVTELAWAAGFFDGEGSIMIVRQRKNGLATSYVLRIEVAQKTREPLDKFAKMFGGKVEGPRADNCYRWRATARTAGETLRLLFPYLMVKKQQADVAIAFQDRRHSGPVTQALREIRYSDDEKDQLRLRELKVVTVA